MATMKKAQNSAKIKKSTVKVEKKTTVKGTPKKKTDNDVKMYNIKGKILSGEGNDAMNQNYNMLRKNGGKMKKAANGTSLGMKSVKAGFDKNPGVTRADIITAAKGKAKSGKTIKKGQNSSIMRPVGLDIGKSTPSMPSIPTGNNAGSSQQKINDNVKKINMSNVASSIKKNMAGAAKNGKSMKKCKYGCK